MIILFVLALVVWIFRPSWLMLLWLISIPILAPIFVFRAGLNDPDEVQSFLLSIWGAFQRAFIIIIVYQIIIKHKKFPTGLYSVLIPLGWLCLYFVFHNGLRHFDVKATLGDIAGAVYYFLPFLVMTLDNQVRPKLKSVYIVLLFIVVVQIIMVPLNMQGIVVYAMRYQDMTFQNELGFVWGTFYQSNALADFLSMAYLYIVVDYFSRKEMPKWRFLALSICVFTLLALTGSKMPFVCSLVAIGLCLFYYRRHILIPILTTLVGLLLILILVWDKVEKLGDEYPGVDRFVSGMSNFVNSKTGKEADESTIRISTALMDNYFMKSPIVGCGYAYKGQEKAYPLNLNFITGLSDYQADATLALYTVEYGLIGVSLFLWYYYSIIKKTVRQVYGRNESKVVLIIFLFLLIFSVTEGGLFYRPNFFYLYTYLFAVQRYREEHLQLC